MQRDMFKHAREALVLISALTFGLSPQFAGAEADAPTWVRFSPSRLNRTFEVKLDRYEADRLGAKNGVEGTLFDGSLIDKVISVFSGDNEVKVGELWTVASVSASEVPSARDVYAVKIPVVVKPEPRLQGIFDALVVDMSVLTEGLSIVDVFPKSSWSPRGYEIDRVSLSLSGASIKGQLELGFAYKPVDAEVIAGAAGDRAFFTFQEVAGRNIVGQFDLILILHAPAGIAASRLRMHTRLETAKQDLLGEFASDIMIASRQD